MDAFEKLVRRHESALRAFLRRVAGHDVADDLAQETFVKAWRRAGDFRGEGSYGAWLFRIAWRLFLSSKRKRMEQAIGEMPEIAGSSPRQEARIDAEAALRELDPKSRGAAILCFGHGYTHVEAARILDLPLGTLKSILARARTKLAERLGEAA